METYVRRARDATHGDHVRLKIKGMKVDANFISLHKYTFKYHLLCALSGFFSSTTRGFYRRCWPYGLSFLVSYSS
jgi:hypothetical protein